MTAPWPLLADLDALLSRDGWQDDASFYSAVAEMERRIADECGILGRHHCLRSRDAAARLEEAVFETNDPRFIEIELSIRQRQHTRIINTTPSGFPWLKRSREHRGPGAGVEMYWQNEDHIATTDWRQISGRNVEPAARTRAALEAGWRLGLWPVGREGVSATVGKPALEGRES